MLAIIILNRWYFVGSMFKFARIYIMYPTKSCQIGRPICELATHKVILYTLLGSYGLKRKERKTAETRS